MHIILRFHLVAWGIRVFFFMHFTSIISSFLKYNIQLSILICTFIEKDKEMKLMYKTRMESSTYHENLKPCL